jgi:hypothetical protein
MTVDIQPTETGGQFWVHINMDGHKMSRHGPFADKAEAEAMAIRFAAVCRAMNAEVVMAAPKLRRSRQWAK